MFRSIWPIREPVLILAKVTLVELSVKYIVKSFAVLWQHAFQVVVCVASAVHDFNMTLPSTCGSSKCYSCLVFRQMKFYIHISYLSRSCYIYIRSMS
jgi:hypothetical protein